MKKNIIALVSIISAFVLFTGCNTALGKSTTQVEPVSKTEVLLGTPSTIKIYDKTTDEVFNKAFDRIREIENKMSVNKETSEVIDINNSAGVKPVAVSEDTFYMIKKGIEFSKDSQGKFDITVGPLVKLWGIGTEAARLPDKAEIEEKKAFINYNDIVLDEANKTVMLKRKGMAIDLGGIAKGYVADEVGKVLSSNGIKHAIINLGGNVLVMNSKPDGEPWRVGIQNPLSENRGDIIGSVGVTSKTVTTAGIYERYYEQDGKKYHHILDPHTGYPAENEIAGITVITDSSTEGDGIDTGILLIGLKEGLEFVKGKAGIEAVFITKNKEIYITPGLKNNFNLTDTSFTLKN